MSSPFAAAVLSRFLSVPQARQAPRRCRAFGVFDKGWMALALSGLLAACGGGQPAGPTVVLQPADQSVSEAAAATFTADTNSAPTWQWQQSSDGGATWADIGGATATSYTTPPTRMSDSGKRFRAVVTNSLGVQSTRGALLTVASGALAYEGFDYPLGVRLKGQSGGSGWAGAWDVADGSGTPLDASLSGLIASGLRYRDSAGNDLITSGGAWQTEASVLRGQALRAGSASFGAAETQRWISFLVRQAEPGSGTNVAAVTPGTGYAAGATALSGGLGSGPEPFVGCFLCAGSDTAAANMVAGRVVMVLMRLDFAATGDSLSLWINPPLDPETALPTPTLSANGNWAELMNGLTLGWGEGRSFTFDELRIADTRNNAAPFAPAPPRNTAGTQVFFTDFTIPTPVASAPPVDPMPAEIAPGSASIEGVQGFGSPAAGSRFSGTMLRSPTGNTVTLTLTELPAHEWLTLDFVFAAIDSLDGSGDYPAGDFFRVTLDGVDLFRESFANTLAGVQTYVPPSGVVLVRRADLGFATGADNTDSAYRLGGDLIFQRIPHSGSRAVVTLRMEGSGAQSLSDESWGIDNLRVRVGP